ncbi:hypothetical protein OQA88_12206 [Cercophora sp. LCS_1]
MDLTPPSLTRSPSTPSHTYCPSERSLDYPSPDLVVEQQYKISSSIYADQACSLTHPLDAETPLPSLDSMGHPDWNNTSIIHPGSAGSPMPSVISGEYEAFGGYPYSHDVYHAHHAIPTSTPPPTSVSRSPIPTGSRTTLSYTSGSLAPRVKMEQEYGQGVDVSHYPSPRSVHASYPPDAAAYTSTSGYLSDGGSSGWQKSDYHQVEPDQYYPGPSGPSTPQGSPFLQDTRRQYRAQRPRRVPRKLTTKEEANFQCEVKGCGKLFSRSYNFKAHMETHDEKREYPFPCTVNDCNKKFVRKTDLQRHQQSVHLRERNHKCDYCGRLFARKDTLRRHMEDGCSKRFDIGTLDLRADGYDAMGRPPPMGGHFGGPPQPSPQGLPPMAIPPLGNSGLLGSMPPSMRNSRENEVYHGWGR